jgi:hypothetical protein
METKKHRRASAATVFFILPLPLLALFLFCHIVVPFGMDFALSINRRCTMRQAQMRGSDRHWMAQMPVQRFAVAQKNWGLATTE